MPEDLPSWEEQLLQQLANDIRYPATPNLVAAVRRRLLPQPRRDGPSWRPVAVAAAIVAVFAAVAILASRDVRDAVADFLGLAVEGERIEIIDPPATLPPAREIETYATPASIIEATGEAGFSPIFPAGRGIPLGTYLVEHQGYVAIVFQYEEFDLWQLQVSVAKGVPQPSLGKGLLNDNDRVIEQVMVKGSPAYWIEGGGQIVRFVDSAGRDIAGSERLATRSTLVWRGSDRNYRLETEMDLQEALALAESLP